MADTTDKAEYEYIRVARADGIGRLTLDRPEVLNALIPEMMSEIVAALRGFEQDNSVRAVLIDGAGSAFSAGGDKDFLDRIAGLEPFEVRDVVYAHFGAAVKALKLCPKPTVAAVQGPAVGAGCEIALACDFRVAGDDALFYQSWIHLGLISPLGGMYLLPRLVGLAKANEMLMLGKKVRAEEALAIGLVNEVAAPGKLEETAVALARRLAAGPPLALRAMKEGIRRGLESSLADEWEHNIYVQSLLIDSKDYAEGIAALREGRTPQFKGR